MIRPLRLEHDRELASAKQLRAAVAGEPYRYGVFVGGLGELSVHRMRTHGATVVPGCRWICAIDQTTPIEEIERHLFRFLRGATNDAAKAA